LRPERHEPWASGRVAKGLGGVVHRGQSLGFAVHVSHSGYKAFKNSRYKLFDSRLLLTYKPHVIRIGFMYKLDLARMFLEILPNIMYFFCRIFNSDFFIAAIGSFAGAYGGYILVERQSKIKSMDSYIHKINSSILMCYEVANNCLSYKNQISNMIISDYEKQIDKYNYFIIKRYFNIDVTPSIDVFINRIPSLNLNAAGLRGVILEELSNNSEPYKSYSALNQCLFYLTENINLLNNHIETEKQKGTPPEQLFNTHYLQTTNKGYIDTFYEDTIYAIQSNIDDCIRLSNDLSAEIGKVGREFVIKNKIKNRPIAKLIIQN